MVLTGMRAPALALSQESWLACSMTSFLGKVLRSQLNIYIQIWIFAQKFDEVKF
jgi:hypothetical protein